jgi:hypothetical protein
MAIPAVLIAAGVRFVARKGLRGLKTFIRSQKEGKGLSGKEIDEIAEKVRAKAIPAKRGGKEVGDFPKLGTTSTRTGRAMAQEGAKAGSRGKVSTKKAIIGAGAVATGTGVGGYMAGAGGTKNRKKAQGQRVQPKDFPKYKGDSQSAKAFRDMYRQAKKAGYKSFTFEGRRYKVEDK